MIIKALTKRPSPDSKAVLREKLYLAHGGEHCGEVSGVLFSSVYLGFSRMHSLFVLYSDIWLTAPARTTTIKMCMNQRKTSHSTEN